MVDRRRAAAAVGVLFTLVVVVLLAAGWIQLPSILFSWYGVGLAVGTLVIVGVVVAAVQFRSDDGIDFSRKSEKQLSEAEAFDLARYILFYERCMRVQETVDRGPVIEGGQREDSDPVRLYQLVFERRNRNEKIGFLMDLEQSNLQVDKDDHELMKETVRQVNNTRLIRASKVEDFNEAMEGAREDLAESLVQTITEREYENGELKRERERPALPYRKSDSNGGSAAES